VLSSFMKNAGVLRADEALPQPRTYVTDEHPKVVDRDPQLKAFAIRTTSIVLHHCRHARPTLYP